VFPIGGKALRSLLEAAFTGRAPGGDGHEREILFTVSRTATELDGRWMRAFHLRRWPRSIPADFVQRLLSLGIPMDLSLHVVPVPASQAARTLEWQKVKMESASSFSLRRGRSPSPETEIALEDVMRLRDDVHRGRERLFHASLSVAVHASTNKELGERSQELRAHFAGVLGHVSGLAFRQRDGFVSTLPLAMNPLGEWRTVDTTTLAYLMPFSPPDLDTRKGTLFGLDLRSGAPITFDQFDPAFLNANMAVLARSGAGKSFSTKLSVLRAIARGITCYVIDPEGEYVGLAEAAGGRVLTPGARGHGLNPFVIDQSDENELLERIGGLRRLVEVMVGERFHPAQRATLDDALTAYYTNVGGDRDGDLRTGFQDFFRFLERDGHSGFSELASLLRPVATGSLRHLLTDDGADLVGHEAPLTVFNLRHLEPELRPAATLVCAEAVWTMATRQPKPRMLVVDEVWSIMQHPEGAAFMVSLAKRARKHRLGLVTITQDVQDFLGVDQSRPIVGHSGRVLLQNSAFKLLLQQDPAALRAVQEAFDLPRTDAQWLTSCPRGEGLLVARGGRFPVRILATPEEQSLIDSKAVR
jgi:type IV secretory pathway VirB4 component